MTGRVAPIHTPHPKTPIAINHQGIKTTETITILREREELKSSLFSLDSMATLLKEGLGKWQRRPSHIIHHLYAENIIKQILQND